MIPIPLQPPDTSLDSVLSSIQGKWEKIDTYKKAWYYVAWLDGQRLGNLNTIVPERGYWIKMTQAADLEIHGAPIPSHTIQLDRDWNLIGWPSLSTMKTEDAFKSIEGKYTKVFAYSADRGWMYKTYMDGWVAGNLDEIEPGMGLWLTVTQEGVLETPIPTASVSLWRTTNYNPVEAYEEAARRIAVPLCKMGYSLDEDCTKFDPDKQNCEAKITGLTCYHYGGSGIEDLLDRLDNDAVVYHLGHNGNCINDDDYSGDQSCMSISNNGDLDNVDMSQALLVYLAGCYSYRSAYVLCEDLDLDDNRNPDVFLGIVEDPIYIEDEIGTNTLITGKGEKVFKSLEGGSTIMDAIEYAAGEDTWMNYYAYCENNGAYVNTLTIKPARYS